MISGREDDISAHLTIANYPKINSDVVLGYTEKFAVTQNRFFIDFISLSIFDNNCIHLTPRISKKLLAIHEEFHKEMDDLCDEYTKLSLNKWTPHTSISHRPTTQVIEKLLEEFQEFKCEVIGLRVKDCDNNFEVVRDYYFK